MEFVTDLGILALGSRLRALSDQLYGIADGVYAAHGVGLQARWFPVLRLLHDRGPSTVGEISLGIGQTHSAVSQLATRLVRDGWLEAVEDASDRRVRRLQVSAQAVAALRDAKPLWRAIEQVLAQRCSGAGIDIMPTLDTLAALLDGSVVDAVIERSRELRSEAVEIVPFQTELREHFYRLNAAWLQRYFYLEEIDHRVLAHPEEEILAGGGAISFALVGQEVVGTCALMQTEAGVFELTKMAVDPSAQGLGIGRLLIEAMIEEFRRRGGSRLFLETNTRLVPAIRLYESSGFVHRMADRPQSHYARANVYMVWEPSEG